MKRIAVFTFMLVIATAANAAGTPLDPHSVLLPGSSGSSVERDLTDARVAYPAGVENNPFYHSLELLTQAEKDNAVIEIMFMLQVSQDAENLARNIEETWNGGDYEQALSMLAELNAMEGVAGNALIGIAWRTPVLAPAPEWGTDVLISARDSVFALAMDHDIYTHNLFALVGFTGDGNASRFSANFSSNGGQTWAETYALSGFSYVMNDLDACCVDDHFYVGYTGGGAAAPNVMAWLKRFQIATGQADTFPDGSTSYNVVTTTEIMEVDVSSNHEQTGLNNRLYFYCIDNTGVIRNFWNDPSTTTWTEIATNIVDAQQGLDTDWNVGYTTYSSIMSVLTEEDAVLIYGRQSTTWTLLHVYDIVNTHLPDWTTAIGGHYDTLFCAFNYDGTYNQIRYLVQYGSGTWYYGFLAPDTLVNNWNADVTLRGSGGIHGAYRGSSISSAYYRNRGYAGTWSTPVMYNDHNASGEIRPQIEFVGNGNYGIMYREPLANGAKCYYDRSDWTGVVEHNVENVISGRLSLAPNPVRRLATLAFTTQQAGRVSVNLYDAAGRLACNVFDASMAAGEHVVTIDGKDLASGVYFVNVATPDGTGTKTMTIVR